LAAVGCSWHKTALPLPVLDAVWTLKNGIDKAVSPPFLFVMHLKTQQLPRPLLMALVLHVLLHMLQHQPLLPLQAAAGKAAGKAAASSSKQQQWRWPGSRLADFRLLSKIARCSGHVLC